ncbi:MAG: hypothetical protein GDA68_20460, partial [Nitrospira sp. CR2.1]|nr:hypothetical protein [Nitrospira sp. CR2.1]
MDRRRRNRICTWLIVLGISNFIVYAIIYAIIGGDAPNGYIKKIDGQSVYYVRGHFVHRAIGYEQDVPRWVWLYSYVHSISIWPSIAATLLAMLVITVVFAASVGTLEFSSRLRTAGAVPAVPLARDIAI